MKKLAFMFALIMPLLITACGNETFQGRFIAPDGTTSYEFLPENRLLIVNQDEVTEASYQYDAGESTIDLSSDQTLPAETLTVMESGNLKMDDVTLKRGVDYTMLADSTWIGHQGEFSFALTFTQTDKGMETRSRLITYYSEDLSYDAQPDDSITRLTGNKLLLDQTPYTVSDVSDNSIKLSIGNNSMILEKHPKGTEIELREGYTNSDDL